MDSLQELLESHELWLTDRIIAYAKQSGYTENSSTLYEPWRLSVAGLSASLAKAVPAQASARDGQLDSFVDFVVLEAERHRERGIRLAMFLGLFKQYRLAYDDLLDHIALAPSTRDIYRRGLNQCFDQAEIAFCSEWSSVNVEVRTRELQTANRFLTNEKNKYLTIFESLAAPAFVFDSANRLENANTAALQYLGQTGAPGAEYYCPLRDRTLEYQEQEDAAPCAESFQEMAPEQVLFWLVAELREFRNSQRPHLVTDRVVNTRVGRRHLEAHFSRILDVSEKSAGTVVVMNDISVVTEARRFLEQGMERLESLVAERTAELRTANAKLSHAEREWKRTFDAVPYLITIVDAQDRILKLNRAMERWMGTKTEDAVSSNWPACARDKGLPPWVYSALGTAGEAHVQDPAGPREYGTFEFTVSPLLADNDRYAGAVYVARDISRRKEAEEALIQSRLLIQSALDALPQDIAILDEKGVIVFSNKAWSTGTKDEGNLTRKSPVGSDFLALCEAENGRECEQAADMATAIRGILSGNSASFSAEFSCHERWVCFTASCFSLGKSRRVLVSFLDITGRKRAERELEGKNEFLTSVLESLTHPFVVIEVDDFTVSLSNSASGIPHSMDRPKCYEVSHGRSQPCDGIDCPCPVSIVKSTGRATLVEHRHQVGCKGSRLAEVHAYPVFDRNGKLTQVIQYMVDITQRKSAELALRESEQKLDGIVGSMTDHLIMTDRDRTIVWANDVAKSLFGSDLVGSKCYGALCNESRGCDNCSIEDCIADGKPHDREHTIIGKEGQAVHFWCTTNVATRYDDGRPKTFVKILRDVTDLKRTQELLLETEGLRAVSELTAGVAHNFRNLLQVIMSAARLVSMEMKDGNLKEADLALEQILRTSYFGAGTIKRIEEFAQPPRELLLKPNEVFDLSCTVAQAIEMSKPWWKSQPQRQGITVLLERDLENGAWVKGQEGQLFEVTVNLLRNAVEALHGDGEIVVRTWIKAPAVFLTVKDSGSGIAAHNIRNVLEPFWTTKVGRGSGMGLATSRRIVASHQGSISVESAPGKGSTFTIRLPLASNSNDNCEKTPREKTGSNLSVLVIDDADQSAAFLSKALERSGHRVVCSLSGEEGLSYCEDHHFDAILCDLCMPDMNGLEVARRVKDACQERGIRKPAFIMVTGWINRELQHQEMLDNGVDGLLEKPADLNQIQELLKKIIRKRQREQAGAEEK
jgi:PAS domain S-box-containing protein